MKHYLNTVGFLSHYHCFSLSLYHQTSWERNYCSTTSPSSLSLTLRAAAVELLNDAVILKVIEDFTVSNTLNIFHGLGHLTLPLHFSCHSKPCVSLSFVDMILLFSLCLPWPFLVVILQGSFFQPPTLYIHPLNKHSFPYFQLKLQQPS